MTSDNSDGKNRKIIAVFKLILLGCIIVGIPAFLYYKFGSEIFSADTANLILEYLNQNRHIAILLIIGLQIIQVVVCFLPGQPIQFASSYMFGVLPGLLFSVIGAVIGTTISFYLAKLLGSEAVHIFFGEERLNDYRDKLNSGRGLLLAFLIYLIPGIPKDLVSYAAGISEIRFRPFLLVATVGRLPGMLGSLFLGHFFGKQNYRAMIILSIIVALILVICFIKRESLIGVLDKIEIKDEEREGSKNVER